MTPPPSDADKPGPGGQTPGAPSPKAPGPKVAKADPKLEAKPDDRPAPVGAAKPSTPLPTQASKPVGGSASTSPTAKPADALGEKSVGSAPTPLAAASGLDGPKAEPAKSGGPIPEPSKPAAPNPELGKPGPAGAASPTNMAARSDGLAGAPQVEPAKSEAVKSEAAKSEPADPAAGKAEPPKSGSVASGPQAGLRPGSTGLTDGPIIDMKAKRIPDPVSPAGGSPGTAAKGPAAAAKSEPGTLSPPPQADKARAGFGSIAAAGLIGGVVGAGLLFAVGKAGIGGGNEGARLTALDQKVSEQVSSIEQRLAGLAPRDALAGLDKRVAGAEAAAKQALDKAGTAPPPSSTEGQASAPGSVPAPSVPADLMARLDSLDQRVAALQEEPGRDQPADSKLSVTQGPASGGDASRIAAFDARLKALESEGAKAPAVDVAQKMSALQGQMETRAKADAEADAALVQRVDGLQQALDARTKAAAEAVQAATQAIRTAAEAGQAQATEAAKALDRRLQEQSDRIAALDKSIAQRAEASTVQAALRVVVADRVTSALAAGAPYAEPLASLRRLDPAAEAKAAALTPFADKGAPTASQLADTFRPIADKIAAKRRAVRAQNAAETSDFRTKLFSMADGLVQVRKVDAPAPEAAAAPEGQVQAALDRGDLRAANTAFATLAAEAQSEAGDFGPTLKARALAGDAAQAVLADAFKALPTQPTPSAAAPAPGR